MAGQNGPPIIPAGIVNALNTFLDHEINGPPIAAIPTEPIIPGNPVFGGAPGMQIFEVHFAKLRLWTCLAWPASPTIR